MSYLNITLLSILNYINGKDKKSYVILCNFYEIPLEIYTKQTSSWGSIKFKFVFYLIKKTNAALMFLFLLKIYDYRKVKTREINSYYLDTKKRQIIN